MRAQNYDEPFRGNGTVILLALVASLTGCVHAQVPKQASALPSASVLQRVVDEAHGKFKDDLTGKNADYIPYLASVPSNLFGVTIVTTDGQIFASGDVNYSFSIQSCSKVF